MEFEDREAHKAVLDDVRIFKDCGGGCIVENTSHGIGRNIPFMVDTSKVTGVHIVAGTGTHTDQNKK
jgi:phosphotriesterase-related protein